MGVAILCLLIGIPLGLVMLCRPKQMWRATQSWKFKNPEANEPSEAGYAVSALGGLVVIIVAIGLAFLAWTTASEKKAADEKQRQQQEWDAEVAAYVPPEPESRGALPIIGYIERPLTDSSRVTYDVYYLHPPNVFDVRMKQMANSRGRYQCVSHAGVDFERRQIHTAGDCRPELGTRCAPAGQQRLGQLPRRRSDIQRCDRLIHRLRLAGLDSHHRFADRRCPRSRTEGGGAWQRRAQTRRHSAPLARSPDKCCAAERYGAIRRCTRTRRRRRTGAWPGRCGSSSERTGYGTATRRPGTR